VTLTLSTPAFAAGLLLSLSLIMAIGPQNAHVLRMGLQRQHVGLTVAVCVLADLALIALGVLGLAQLGGLSDKLHGALVGAGVVFLLIYGGLAWRRFWHPPVAAAGSIGTPAPTGPAALGLASPASPAASPAVVPISRLQAVLAALAFSWLNPHAWLDTAVLIGSASLAWGAAGPDFGLGAATASLLWFLLLGGAAFWLGQRLNSLRLWRALDGVVALMMWGMAGLLLHSLF